MLKTITINNEAFQVYDAGRGSPILLAHGFPLDHSMWQGQLAVLSANYRVIAPDLRGFGRSVVTRGTVTMEQLADDCAALLDALAVGEPITFCGLSMGGYVGWQFWRRHAARLARLVICDSRAVADTAEGAAGRIKMAESVLRHGTAVVADAMIPKLLAPATLQQQPGLVERLRQTILAAPPEGVAAAQRGMAARPDVQAWLPEIRVPTLGIVGHEDAISTPDEMRKIVAAISGARLCVLPGAGHMSPLEAPIAFNEALAAFLRS
jgi:pimeloyl-ACP methyl ester carboxylesterase